MSRFEQQTAEVIADGGIPGRERGGAAQMFDRLSGPAGVREQIPQVAMRTNRIRICRERRAKLR